MEQIAGVAPAYSVWKTDILLLNYICIRAVSSIQKRIKSYSTL